MINYLYNYKAKKKKGPKEIDEQDYKKDFIDVDKNQIEAAFNKAWEAKNIETDLYWKRATYFWALQAVSFAGYFSVSESVKQVTAPEGLFIIICIGFITSMALALINKGSKTWQRYWEIHIDMLEDKVTGPLFKTTTTNKTYSTTKINEIISWSFVTAWIGFGAKYFGDYLTFSNLPNYEVDWLVISACILTFYFTGAMFWGHGRGRFRESPVTFYRRSMKVKGTKTSS